VLAVAEGTSKDCQQPTATPDRTNEQATVTYPSFPCLFLPFLARLENLPEGLYILPMFFLYFLVVASGAPLAQKPMDRSSPKFQDW